MMLMRDHHLRHVHKGLEAVVAGHHVSAQKTHINAPAISGQSREKGLDDPAKGRHHCRSGASETACNGHLARFACVKPKNLWCGRL
jgi:hypothetical protein